MVSRVRRAACLLLLGLAFALAAAAEDEPSARPKPLEPDEAARRVLAAATANDQAGLKALAAADDPDPWFVVEVLCEQGRQAAAEAFARAGARAATAKLPAYVKLTKDAPLAAGVRDTLDEANRLLRAGKAGELLALLSKPVEPGRRVTTIRLALVQAVAFVATGRRVDGMRRASEVAVAAERLGWHAYTAKAAYFAGITAYEASRWPAAITSFERSLKAYTAVGNEERAADALNALGVVHKLLGRYDDALGFYNRARRIAQRRGDHESLASVFHNIGVVHAERGNFHRALAYYERSLKIERQLGNKAGISASLTNIGNVHHDLGDFARALEVFERALAIDRELDDQRSIAVTLNSLGALHRDLGDRAKALAHYEASMAIRERLDDRQGVATTRLNIGNLHADRGEYDLALDHYRRALTIVKAIKQRRTEITLLKNIANTHSIQGRPDDAAKHFAQARELAEALRDQQAIASVTTSIAYADLRRGRLDDAARGFADAESQASDIGARALHVRALRGLAHVAFARGRFAEAAKAARAAVDASLLLVSGLDEQQGAEARDRRAGPIAMGAQAAFEEKDVDALLYFAEQGRAGSLRESLRARRTLDQLVIPQALRDEEARARRTEAAAQRAYGVAVRRGKLKEARAARRDLDAARSALEQVVRKIQRAVKARGDLAYPEAPTEAAVRALLAPGDALVLYVLARDHIVAVTLTRTKTTLARLPTAEDVQRLCAALDLTDAKAQPDAALARLRQALIEPLGLGDDARRVLVSPQGAMAYVPFATLLGEREVLYVPSALTLALLQTERTPRGTKTLALGDPDYTTAAKRLPQLPGTRAEVRALGDTVLVGKEASETRFRAALDTEPGWRAVHLACHGLLDTDRPLQTSLALAADAANDGRLTTLDVFRMNVRADLAVLSACETGRGRLHEAEGIIGLTRAFMFAGAPRVLCSLWKVDDKATQALMVKFYALWKPQGGKGITASKALKEAQAHVRAQEKWKHPYYWAAWVLWGLPD